MLSPLVVPRGPVDALPASAVPRLLQDRTTGIVLAGFFAVHRELGHGFTDAVYQRALALELASRGVHAEQDASVSVFYKGTKVGQHRVPFLVEGRVLVDLAAGPRLDMEDVRRLTQGLRATSCAAALLLHFGVAATFRHLDRDT